MKLKIKDDKPRPLPEISSDGERKIIFRHKRAIGDALMMTSGVRDFKTLFPEVKVNVDSNFPALWEGNPYLDRDIKKDDPGVEFYNVGYPAIQCSNNGMLHFGMAFLFDMISTVDLRQSLGLPLGEFTSIFAGGRVGDSAKEYNALADKYRKTCNTFARQWPDIYLTEEEKTHNLVKDRYGVEKYWLIAPGGKTDCTTKIWDWRKFQEVISHFEGRIKFASIGRSDHVLEKLNGVIDLTDKFNDNVRGLLPLTYHAEGCVTGVSFLLHLAAAMPPRINSERKPCVAIYGGREPTSFTWYCNHQVLHNNGAFTCCERGGCWQSRVTPVPTNYPANKRLCHNTVRIDDRTIQACMDVITTQDVIRAIEKYYDGDIYKYMKLKSSAVSVPASTQKPARAKIRSRKRAGKEINILASLSTKGGGEQSALKIADILRDDGWKVHFYPWAQVHDNYKDYDVEPYSFQGDMEENMRIGLPLLFYANDQIWDFVKHGEELVRKSSALMVNINFCNGTLPNSEWIAKSGKLKAVIFHNREKMLEYERDEIGINDTEKIVLYGAIDMDKLVEVCPEPRAKGDPLVILKHCVPDGRKYVTKESEGLGKKIHLWQKNIIKENDVKFYGRLLKDVKNTRFEFMEAHKELVNAYPDEPRMVFHKWNAMPVTDFLARGHLYLYRTSNAWRDQYPRVVAEALMAGLPVLSEPRDGTKDRMDYGNIGFSCIDYDGFLYAVRMLQRKENYRQKMGMEAKRWAKKNLDPRKWANVINEVLL